MGINIADYTRPGVFINEIDDSVRQVAASTALINLVVGFSRKGPINKPVLISTPEELYSIFGDIDRMLEKKGSFFHRTILNNLGSAPVWVVNLLATDDDLDLIEWQSISTSSDTENGTVIKSPYSRMYDRADFWERDSDSFLTVADENRVSDSHILHMTNMSNKKSSVFIYKSSAAGYDDTLDSYYGSVDQVPAYLSPKDQAKDYLVSVLIVAGDWSDYSSLSVDSRWSQYFNAGGLRKEQVQNFRNDRAVNILAYYADLSLIPYFRNLQNRDIFIETVINNETDRHGIFVSYDTDRVEDTDFRTGVLDLIGSNLVDSEQNTINYLSYKETITEDILFETVELDRAGNAFGKNLEFETFISGTVSTSQINGAGFTEVTVSGINYININGTKVIPDTESLSVDIQNVNIGKIRKDALFIDENGALGAVTGYEVSNQTMWDNVPLQPLPTGVRPVAVVSVGEYQGTSLDIDSIAHLENLVWGLQGGGTSGYDIEITYNGVNEIVYTFTDTADSDPDTLYRKTVIDTLFSSLQSNIIQGVSIIKDAGGDKIPNAVFTFDTSVDNTLTVTTSPAVNINSGEDTEIYFIDDEQIFTPSTGSVSYGLKTAGSTTGYGIASVNSDIYKAYQDGEINSGDFFYPALFDNRISKSEFFTDSGNSTIRLWYNNTEIDYTKLSVNREIKFVGTESNDKIFTILNNGGAVGGQPGDFNTYVDLIVNESITAEVALTEVSIHGASDSDIRYLKMWFEGSNLTVEFTQDSTLVGKNGIDFVTDFNLDSIRIYSNRQNYKQSLEIESVLQNNEVLVSAERYGEVKIGDYLQAYVNTAELEAGENPKRLTRIIDKKIYSGDSSLISLKTDSAIDIINFGTDAQTFRYTSVEDYVNTYTALTFKGFQMRAASMPDGTEERQNDILNTVAYGTPIFKGLVNRNKLSWRYLIDCWGLGLTASSKQQFADLCGEKLTALGLLSMPSAKAFKNSQSPSFIDRDDKTLRTDFIKKGADPDSNPAFRYSFAQGKGQSNIAYFFPYVTVSDGNRPLSVPPAMFVANTFMRKHNTRLATLKPWTPAAGTTYGRVLGVGALEMDLTPDDITNLNLMGANPIINYENWGACIETNNTAQVSPKSSLSDITSREVLISLENEMYQMLLLYKWRENTPEVREEVKKKADDICTKYKKQNGLYDFVNICDESNNTEDLIDSQIVVVDTYVEITRNIAILVNNIHVKRTGTLSSTGFNEAGQ